MNFYLLFCLGIIHPVYTLLTNSPNNGLSLGGRIQRQKAAQQQQHPSTSIFTLPPTLESLVTDTLDADRKIIVVTGGVLSGIGKGVTASSIGVLFRAMGYRVTALKIDPYLNVDAGTMSPFVSL